MHKILIVEDDTFLNKMYDVGFRHEGFDVLSAFDGEDGFQKAKEFVPDIILLDLMLPKMDGFAVLDALKKNQKTQRIPVFILSNLSQSSDIKRVMDRGAELFLEKNKYTVKEIAEVVRNRIEQVYAPQHVSV